MRRDNISSAAARGWRRRKRVRFGRHHGRRPRHAAQLAGVAKALCRGILATGLNVIDVGMIDTSMIYYAINRLDCVGGIQTTASHNPAQYNGFKISGPKAKPIGQGSGLDDIKRIAGNLRVGQTASRASSSSRTSGPATATTC